MTMYGKPAGTDLGELSVRSGAVTVAVIIPIFNHARYLSQAIASVLVQTRLPDEIIVVDDGSTDNPSEIVALFPNVRLIRTENRGPSAARNTGFRSCNADYVVFFDADDRLYPNALEVGLACVTTDPECAFVFGGIRRVSVEGGVLSEHIYKPLGEDPYVDFLHGNQVSGIMSVLFRRDRLLAENGFDESLRRAEDYDLYLRMACNYRILAHPELVAEYIRHDENISNDHGAQLKATLLVLGRQARYLTTDARRRALSKGRRYYRRLYAYRMVDAAMTRWRSSRNFLHLSVDVAKAARWAPFEVLARFVRAVAHRVEIH